MIKLYHGSNVSIDDIDLTRSKKGKDFGRGFYLNANMQQAHDMAKRTARFLGGEPILSTFMFNEEAIEREGLKVKIFEEYSEEWAEFIVRNRKNSSDDQAHDYDIVIGPIADDNVGVQVRRFIMGYIPASILIEELRFKEPAIQYFFGTEKAIKLLKRYRI